MIIQSVDTPIYKKYTWLKDNHDWGGCLTHNSLNYAYVAIPKNASRWILQWLHSKNFSAVIDVPNDQKFWGPVDDVGFRYSNYNFIKQGQSNYKFIVILRDPYKRWISGIIEMFHRKFPGATIDNPVTINKIFTDVRLDEHTDYQVNYLSTLNTDSCIFFNLEDPNFKTSFINYMSNTFSISYDVEIKEYSHGETSILNINKMKAQLQEIIDKNPDYITRVKDFYKPDYDLINQVQFYQ